MLNENLEFNYRSIRSFASYTCKVDETTLEKEIAFHVDLGPSTERKGDSFPVYEVPDGKMVWLSDWSFNSGGPLNRAVSVGGSLGRITPDSYDLPVKEIDFRGNQIFYGPGIVLNCAISAGETEMYSPARPIRYVSGEWLSVCFHHMGEPLDVGVRATFRFTEVPSPKDTFKTKVFNWRAKDKTDLFPGQT